MSIISYSNLLFVNSVCDRILVIISRNVHIKLLVFDTCYQMNSYSFKTVTDKLFIYKSYIFNIYAQTGLGSK